MAPLFLLLLCISFVAYLHDLPCSGTTVERGFPVNGDDNPKTQMKKKKKKKLHNAT